VRRGERRESPGLGESILHFDWLTPYCLKIAELIARKKINTNEGYLLSAITMSLKM
jgi:hypothetical protein